jgi:hypothetical protein
MTRLQRAVLTAVAGLLLAFSLLVSVGCGLPQDGEDAAGDAAQAALGVGGELLEGDVIGEIGKDYRTQWFTFNVISVTKVAEYAGITAQPESELIDVVIYEKNIFNKNIPMGAPDFYMDAPSLTDFISPMEPADDSMMPMQFELAPGESASYHMLYEVPVDTPDLVLQYIEVDELGTEGATFTININL